MVYNVESKNDSGVADWVFYPKTPLFCIFTFLNAYTRQCKFHSIV